MGVITQTKLMLWGRVQATPGREAATWVRAGKGRTEWGHKKR